MEKISKNCAVRLPEALHREAKVAAYKAGLTLQEYIINLIHRDLEEQEKNAPDGGWRHVIREQYKE